MSSSQRLIEFQGRDRRGAAEISLLDASGRTVARPTAAGWVKPCAKRPISSRPCARTKPSLRPCHATAAVSPSSIRPRGAQRGTADRRRGRRRRPDEVRTRLGRHRRRGAWSPTVRGSHSRRPNRAGGAHDGRGAGLRPPTSAIQRRSGHRGLGAGSARRLAAGRGGDAVRGAHPVPRLADRVLHPLRFGARTGERRAGAGDHGLRHPARGAFYVLSRRAWSRSALFQRESAELRQLNRRLQREIAERERVRAEPRRGRADAGANRPSSPRLARCRRRSATS